MNIRCVRMSLAAVIKKSFSSLGQKVNKKIAAYGRDADDSSTDLLTG